MSATAGIRDHLEADGILHVVFDQPERPVNLLDGELLKRLSAILEQVRVEEQVKGVLFRSAKPENFLAGMDIDSLSGIDDAYRASEGARFGQTVFQKLADLSIPTACAIQGGCMGGGTELALACDIRLAGEHPTTLIGLPEVRIGIIPGFGGTQRLPRLVGFTKAVDMIVAGRRLNSRQALRAGLVDEIVLPGRLEARAVALLRQAADGGDRPRAGIRGRRSAGTRMLDWAAATVPPVRRWVLNEARRKLTVKADPMHYPAPYRALEALDAAVSLPLPQGLDIEARIIGELIPGETARNLMWLFRSQAAFRKPSGSAGGTSRKVAKAGVIGAGIMGGGIAALIADQDIPVRLKDLRFDPILTALRTAREGWNRKVRRGRLDPGQRDERMARIAPTVHTSGFTRCDLVVEAVVEDLEVKQQVLAELEPLMADRAVFASNTSSIPIGEIAAAAARPDRVVGLHFFNPVDRMPLVEVIAGPESSADAVATVRDFALRLGKLPIVVKDSPGFLVNRILMFYLGEAIRLLEEGVRIDAVDAAMTRFGMPLGPFALMDEIGLDTVLHVARVLQAAYGKRAEGSTRALESLILSERRGVRAGGGFYRYRRGKRTLPDPEAYSLSGAREPRDLPPETIQERLVLAMVNEAAVCLEDGVVERPVDLDIAMVTGTGFPPFRGGLLRYADSNGIAVTVDRLARLADAHGERFRPAGLLREMVMRQKLFYGDGK
ncbi:MAG: enoyl-CoA hydratase/isomerase family protein [Acidobacteria bacterium]|uniref:Enoyl-CoA hydratase/isomerase family protein n=1 Tax=Candidatus Polarisedimenticola svalbardensis TaxID=2886004 RepID=A0A8J6Y004_9BACT|nr:enoyl-CoA hydratase/isomerase family protein [Candidatus Polarisedimenticola svalbardensis]